LLEGISAQIKKHYGSTALLLGVLSSAAPSVVSTITLNAGFSISLPHVFGNYFVAKWPLNP